MMLKGCNAYMLQTLAHSRFSPKTKTKTPFRGISVVSCSPSSKTSTTTTTADSDLVIKGNRLNYSLLEDGLSYKENFIVRCYEVGINKTAIVETMPNLLQISIESHLLLDFWIEISDFKLVEFGRMNAARGSRMHIEIYKYPALGDVVEIETWCQSEGRTGTRRDWILKDFASGVVIGRATSKWVMMNQDTRTLQKVNDDVRDEYLVFCPWTPQKYSSPKKIPKLEEPVQYSKLGLVVILHSLLLPSRADLDMNQRVNNVTYFGWVLECQHNNTVDSLTSPELLEDVDMLQETNGSVTGRRHEMGTRQLLHFLILSGERLELNRWKGVKSSLFFSVVSVCKLFFLFFLLVCPPCVARG
ncbi:hypothetical protein MKX03_031084 [Papaver bracteatum]|nr:hypothetical protein MKX03_031084 [Papaver bracteatum]